jgi:hypothetical protein
MLCPRNVSTDLDVSSCKITEQEGLVGHTAAVCSGKEVGSPQENRYTRLDPSS